MCRLYIRDGRVIVSLTDISLFEAVCVNTSHANTSLFYVYWTRRKCGKVLEKESAMSKCTTRQ